MKKLSRKLRQTKQFLENKNRGERKVKVYIPCLVELQYLEKLQHRDKAM